MYSLHPPNLHLYLMIAVLTTVGDLCVTVMWHSLWVPYITTNISLLRYTGSIFFSWERHDINQYCFPKFVDLLEMINYDSYFYKIVNIFPVISEYLEIYRTFKECFYSYCLQVRINDPPFLCNYAGELGFTINILYPENIEFTPL